MYIMYMSQSQSQTVSDTVSVIKKNNLIEPTEGISIVFELRSFMTFIHSEKIVSENCT
jgi:hypothetical protein